MKPTDCVFVFERLTSPNGPQLYLGFIEGQTPKSDIPPNIAPKVVTLENYLQISDSSPTLIGQLTIVTLSGAILGGIPLSGPYPFFNYYLIGLFQMERLFLTLFTF